jgi:predicted dehydrogenase
VLLEKPVGVHLDEVRRLVEASNATGVPVLVGHHRRHNPLIVVPMNWSRAARSGG